MVVEVPACTVYNIPIKCFYTPALLLKYANTTSKTIRWRILEGSSCNKGVEGRDSTLY